MTQPETKSGIPPCVVFLPEGCIVTLNSFDMMLAFCEFFSNFLPRTQMPLLRVGNHLQRYRDLEPRLDYLHCEPPCRLRIGAHTRGNYALELDVKVNLLSIYQATLEYMYPLLLVHQIACQAGDRPTAENTEAALELNLEYLRQHPPHLRHTVDPSQN